jgi:hypothetical protein
LTCLSIAVLICAALVGTPAHAVTVTAQSETITDKTFTFTNNGATTASISFELAGNLVPTTTMSGTGSATVAFSGTLMNGVDTVFTAPTSGAFDDTYTFDIASGATVVLKSTGDASATASASSPSGSAQAIASDSGTSTISTSVSGVALTITSDPPTAYMLSVTGDNPPMATGFASFSVVGLFTDSLTTGSKSVPLTGTILSTTLDAGTPLVSSATSSNEADAAVAPEPSTLLGALVGLLGLGGYAWRRRVS